MSPAPLLKRRPPRYSRVQRAGMEHEKALALAVERADGALKPSRDRLMAALQREQQEAVFDAFPWERWRNELDRRVTPVVRDAFAAGGLEAEHTVMVPQDKQGRALVRKQGVLEGVFSMRLPRAQRAAADRAARLVTNIDRSTRQAMRDIITRAFRDNVSVRDQAQQIERLLYQGAGLDRRRAAGLYNFEQRLQRQGVAAGVINRRVSNLRGRMMHDRAVTIARHETLEAAAAGQQETWMQAIDDKRLPKNMEREWITAQDERLCPICAPMNGQRRPMKEPFWSNYSKQKYLRPPAHVMCLPGDALILPRGRVTAASKRWFDDDLAVIQCAGSLPLACTPNHPILTRRGWVAAGEINVGDEVAHPGIRQRIGLGDRDNVDVPSRIEDVAKAFLNDPGVVSVPMPTTAEDFHGDGVDAQIAVVGTDGLLRDGLHAMLAQRIGQHRFKCGHVGHVLLPGARGLSFASEGLGLAARGFMGSTYLPAPLRWRHPAPLQRFGLRAAAWLDAVLTKYAPHRSAGAVEGTGQAKDGLAAVVEPDDLVFRQVTLRSHRAFSGWVYNLETTTGYYVANGYATHNCRCTVGLVEPKEKDKLPPPSVAPEPAAPTFPLPATRFTEAQWLERARLNSQRGETLRARIVKKQAALDESLRAVKWELRTYRSPSLGENWTAQSFTGANDARRYSGWVKTTVTGKDPVSVSVDEVVKALRRRSKLYAQRTALSQRLEGLANRQMRTQWATLEKLVKAEGDASVWGATTTHVKRTIRRSPGNIGKVTRLRKNLKESNTFMRRVVPKRYWDAMKGQDYRITTGWNEGWSYHHRGPRKISMDTYQHGVIIHEHMHALEAAYPRLLDRSVAFWKKRTAGDAWVTLDDASKALRGHGWGRASDKGYWLKQDKWGKDNLYAGKFYGERHASASPTWTASEVLTMGMQRMSEDPLAFYNADNEWFTWVLDFLRGNGP